LESASVRRDTLEQTRQRAVALAAGEPDKRVQIRLRAKLGGEQMTDLAGEFGYRDGSGVLQVGNPLEARSATDEALARQMRQLRSAFDVRL
jgi:hypothetical protein